MRHIQFVSELIRIAPSTDPAQALLKVDIPACDLLNVAPDLLSQCMVVHRITTMVHINDAVTLIHPGVVLCHTSPLPLPSPQCLLPRIVTGS